MSTAPRTFLGWTPRTAVTVAVVAVAAGVALGLAVEPPHPCGTVTEDHVAAPAYCGDPSELVEMLDRVRAERSGGRFAPAVARSDSWRTLADARYVECATLLAADDWDAAGCASRWPDLDARSRELWGPDGDPETGADR